MLADVISPQFYAGRCEPVLWALTVGSIAALVFGADRLVSSAVKLARALGVSTVIIGATIVSLGTTSPEAAVSVRAAWAGDAGLALGNGIGSVICNMALIFGLCCCLTRLPLDRFVLYRYGMVQLGGGLLLAAVAAAKWFSVGGSSEPAVLGRGFGVVLTALLIGFMLISIRWARRHPEFVVAGLDGQSAQGRAVRSVLICLFVLILGLSLVVGGAEVLIGSVKQICIRHRVPQAVLAGTLVALGTSLPELVTAIASVVKGHSELLVGNVVGANILNVLFVIGASALAKPLKLDSTTMFLFLPVMLLVLALFTIFGLAGRGRFSRWQGVPLLLAYAVFVFMALRYFGVGAS